MIDEKVIIERLVILNKAGMMRFFDLLIEEIENMNNQNTNLVENDTKDKVLGGEIMNKTDVGIGKNANISGLEFHNLLVERLNNNATRYTDAMYEGHRYPEAEFFEVDEVYDIISRVLSGIPEDDGLAE